MKSPSKLGRQRHLSPPQGPSTLSAAARVVGLPVLAWALAEKVARQLNTELGTAFVGRPAEQLDLTWTVSRQRQRRAIDCHHSQSTDNPPQANAACSAWAGAWRCWPSTGSVALNGDPAEWRETLVRGDRFSVIAKWTHHTAYQMAVAGGSPLESVRPRSAG